MGLKIKKTKETRKSKRDLIINLDVNTGKLFIEVKNNDPTFRNASVVFDLNGDDQTVNLDENGKGILEFEKQKPPFQYMIKIKNRGPLKDDQKLAFWY